MWVYPRIVRQNRTFLMMTSALHQSVYQTGWRVAREAVTWLTQNAPIESMHTAACFVSLYESLRVCGGADGIDMEAFRAVLEGQIAHVLTQDTSVWATEYVCKPSMFIESKDSAFYPANRALCDAECAFIDRTQQEDGTWAITWDWGAYPQDWPVSRDWWRADVIIKNVRFCRAMRG